MVRVREYYEKLYGDKLDNVDDIDIFLEIFILPKVKQEKIENLK